MRSTVATAYKLPSLDPQAWNPDEHRYNLVPGADEPGTAILVGSPAGGDLGGTYPDPTVDHVDVAAIDATGTPDATTFLRGDGSWETPSDTPGGAAGGDLSGSYPDPSVASVSDGVLGSGTPDATTYLRGDRTWQVPPSAGADVVKFLNAGDNGKKMTVGTGTGANNGGAGQTLYASAALVSVSFPTAYASAPIVIAQAAGGNGIVSATSTSTTGFSTTMLGWSAAAASGTISYIAVGAP